jgi:AAA+ superfamily predicted ATPase
MAVDESVIAAMAAAVEVNPENPALRIHLISLLIPAQRYAEALEHCVVVLKHQPDNVEILRYAAQAAEAVGENTKAEGYRRLYQALTGSTIGNSQQEQHSEQKEHFTLSSKHDDNADGQEVEEEDSKGGGRGNVVPLRVIEGGAGSDDLFEAEMPEVKLADVAGMEDVKRRLNLAFLAPMKNPEMRKMFGKSLRGGLLLYGPPGCGKTFIARAVAGELGAKFMSVGLADVLDMWLGNSEKNLHETFETARRNAPCVLFFDEVDALGRKRSLVRHSASSNVVIQLLSELDSIGAKNRGVFVLAATNHPWDVDTALRRPGRLDRVVLVLPPDAPARLAILQYHLQGRPLDKLDLEAIAAKTEDYSGADMAHLCEAAAELAMEESLQSGKPRGITMEDFKRALKEVRPSTRAWLEMARNYAMFANEGGVYDDLLKYLRLRKIL